MIQEGHEVKEKQLNPLVQEAIDGNLPRRKVSRALGSSIKKNEFGPTIQEGLKAKKKEVNLLVQEAIRCLGATRCMVPVPGWQPSKLDKGSEPAAAR